MKNIYLIAITLILISCSSDEPENCCVVVDTAVTIKYVNDNNENLLEGENSIDVNNIKVFHKIDSEWKEYFEGNMDYPKGLTTVEINGENFLRIFVSTDIDENQVSETKLEFSDNNEDIIKTELNLSANNTIITRVWYNDNLEWDMNDNLPRQFIIVK